VAKQRTYSSWGSGL